MKTLYFLFFVGLIISCNSNHSKKNNLVIQEKEISINDKADTIRTLLGFYIGMTEKEIKEYVKDNPKFFIDKAYLMPTLRTKIDNKVYTIHFKLYKGALYEIELANNEGWDDIDDIKFREHYNNIYKALSGLNKYKEIENVYSKKVNVDWPYSYSGEPITMAEFRLTTSDFNNMFVIQINQNIENYSYCLWITYNGNKVENYDSTLYKDLYFD